MCVVVFVHGKSRKDGRKGGEKKVVLKCGTVDDIRSAAWLKQEQIRYDTFREDQFLKKKKKKKT